MSENNKVKTIQAFSYMNKSFCILSIVAVVALFTIVIVEFDLGFVPCDIADNMNSVLTILCSGYIGGYLTYTTTVYIPDIIDYRKTKDARKKSFAIIAEIVRGHIVAYINEGIHTDVRKITVEKLMECLKKHPLYEQCIVSPNDGTLCEKIWGFISFFQSRIFEYHTIWAKYLTAENHQVLSNIENNAFYRAFNDNFSLYNSKPIICKNGERIFAEKILGRTIAIDEAGYDSMISTELNNLLELIKLLDEFNNQL